MSEVQKHEALEAAAVLGTAEEITEALKINNPVDQMIALQGLGLEVLPVQGNKPVEEPWTVSDEDKKYEKISGGRPMTPEEWEEWAPTVSRKKSHREDGSPKHWKQYDSRTPLEFYATDDALDFFEKKYYGAGVICQNGLIGIDADTPEEVAYLEEWLYENSSSRMFRTRLKVSGVPFTVRTPGKVSLGDDGEPVWKHSEGGHLWIRMPEGWADGLPARAKEKTTIENDSTGFDVIRGGRYFLTAGTTRTEGPYRLVGEVLDATNLPGLVEAIKEAFTPAPAPEPTRIMSPSSITPGAVSGMTTAERIEEWAEARSWSSIFSELGWAHTPICNGECVEFTHPDSSSGSHSGVAHGPHCSSGPVPDAVTIYGTTAQSATGLEGVVKKYKFVLEVLYKGDTNAFFTSEPIREETPVKPIAAPRAPKSINPPKGNTETPKGILTPKENTETPGEDTQETPTVTRSEEEVLPKTSEEVLDEARAKAIVKEEAEKKSHQALLDAARLIMEVRHVRPGVFSYLPITEQGVVPVDQGEDWAIHRIRNARKGVIPATETKAKTIISVLKDEASEAVSHMGVANVEETPRFWSGAEGDSLMEPSYIYRGRSDWGRTAPFYEISSEGYRESAGGEAAAVFIEREDFAPLDVDLTATVRDLEDLWTFINVPQKSRAMVLGALITAWVCPKATRPIIFVTGATGTGKTLTTERLSALVDPKSGGETTVSTRGDGSAIGQAGLGNETLVIGNVSSISRQASDALAQLGGSSTKVERTLYKNGRNSAYVIRSTAIISTKETGMVLQDDFLNRMIPILPGTLSVEQKRLGARSQDWKEALPRFRGALMALAAAVKRDAVENPDREFSRDYRWQTVGNVIERVEVVLGEHGMEAVQPWAEVLRDELHALKGDSLPPIIEWIRDDLGEIVSGSPNQVYSSLVDKAGGKGSPATSGWVESGRALTTLLQDYSAVLEGWGVTASVDYLYPGTQNTQKKITITPKDSLGFDDEEFIEDI